MAIFQWVTDGLNRDGTLRHSYLDDECVLVPLGHWNWKRNEAGGNYSTYKQELLAGMLVLSSDSGCWGATLWFGYVSKSRSVPFKIGSQLGRLSQMLVELDEPATALSASHPGRQEQVCGLHQPPQL